MTAGRRYRYFGDDHRAKQVITTTGDVTLRGSDGSNGIATHEDRRRGGATPGATDTTLNVGRDLILTGAPQTTAARRSAPATKAVWRRPTRSRSAPDATSC